MVATWKKDIVSAVAKQVKSHKVVGVVKVSGIPSKQMQSMRKKLTGEASIIVSRSNILQRGLEKAGIKEMGGYMQGPSGVIITDLNPFQLEKLLYSNRTNAPAKPGSIAPYDLIIPEGDTGLLAGPVIGDLQGAGVKAKIQGGKIIVTQDSLLVKAGEKVDEKSASVLARLGVEPMEIELKLQAAYEDGTIYPGDILHVEESQTKAKLQNAHQRAFNLAFNARVFNKATVEMLILEAITKTRNLMINAEILNKETVGIYLAKADAQANALKAALPEDLAKEVKKEEEKTEGKKPADEKKEPPKEEKKEEAKEEKKKEPKEAVKEEKKTEKEEATPQEETKEDKKEEAASEEDKK